MRKILKKMLPCLLTLSLILGYGNAAAAAPVGRTGHRTTDLLPAAEQFTAWPEAPGINAEAAICIELNSGVILYDKNARKPMYPASMTKIITALLTIENCDLGAILTLSHNSVTDLVEGGYTDGFYEGETFCIEDALYLLCLNSNNSVAYALAEYMDGNLSAFADRMNRRAAELGAENTDFQNPHGLNDPNHLTTAYDIAKILWGAIENDTYLRIAGTQSYSFSRGLSIQQSLQCEHTVWQMDPTSVYYDSRVICGKTGFVDEAGYCLVTYATDGNLDLITVTMNASSKPQAAQDNLNIMRYGFDNFFVAGLPISSGTEVSTTWETSKGPVDVTFYVELPDTSTGFNKLLVPNTALSGNWEREFTYDEAKDSFYLTYHLGGEKIVTYPLTLVASSGELFPAESTEESQEEPSQTETASASSADETSSESTQDPETTEPQTEPSSADPTESAASDSESGDEHELVNELRKELREHKASEEQLTKTAGVLKIITALLALAVLILLVLLIVTLRKNRSMKDRLLAQKIRREQLAERSLNSESSEPAPAEVKTENELASQKTLEAVTFLHEGSSDPSAAEEKEK